MPAPRRKSIRLKGYDYTQAGEYFVTICAKDQACIFGEIVERKIILSQTGAIAVQCWREIPEHFPGTRVDSFQVMPSHVHGIIEIIEDPSVLTRHSLSQQRGQRFKGEIFGKPRPGSLSTIIRSFKSAVTKQVHDAGLRLNAGIWHPRFYDSIVRNEIGRFYVEQYIELNPLLWYLNSMNPRAQKLSVEEIRRILRSEHHLEGVALEWALERAVGNRRNAEPRR